MVDSAGSGRRHARCVWQEYLAHFGGLIWPTPKLLILRQGGLGLSFYIGRGIEAVEMWESRSDFQGRWEGWKTWVWFSRLSTDRHFHGFPVSVVWLLSFVSPRCGGSDTIPCLSPGCERDR